MSKFANWRQTHDAVDDILAEGALNAKVRVYLAITVLNACGDLATPTTIADRCGLPPRTTATHLKDLRAAGLASSAGGAYVCRKPAARVPETGSQSAENRQSAAELHASGEECRKPAVKVPKTGSQSAENRQSAAELHASGEECRKPAVKVPKTGSQSAENRQSAAELHASGEECRKPAVKVPKTGSQSAKNRQSAAELHASGEECRKPAVVECRKPAVSLYIRDPRSLPPIAPRSPTPIELVLDDVDDDATVALDADQAAEQLVVLDVAEVDAMIAKANARHIAAGVKTRDVGRRIVDDLAKAGIGRVKASGKNAGEVVAWDRAAVMRRLKGAIVGKATAEVMGFWAAARADAGLDEDVSAATDGRKNLERRLMPRCSAPAEEARAIANLKKALTNALLSDWDRDRGLVTLAHVCRTDASVQRFLDMKPVAARRVQQGMGGELLGKSGRAPQPRSEWESFDLPPIGSVSK